MGKTFSNVPIHLGRSWGFGKTLTVLCAALVLGVLYFPALDLSRDISPLNFPISPETPPGTKEVIEPSLTVFPDAHIAAASPELQVGGRSILHTILIAGRGPSLPVLNARRIRNPSKTDFIRHAFDRLDHRVETRTQQRCAGWNTTGSERFLAHDFGSGRGLGNYMFMVASTLGLAVSSGRTPIIDDPYAHLKIFNNSFPKRKSTQNPKDAVRFTSVPSPGKYDATLSSRLSSDNSSSLLLTGYLQSWKFFNQERHTIRCQFTFATHVYKSALEALKSKLRQFPQNILDSSRLIGIHVRRGDITAADQNVQGHVPASDQYLLDSYAELDALYKSQTVFVVLSNDLTYCQSLFAERTNFVFMEGNSAAVDLAILSLMDDVILTVGTYGWWGAFLSDAAVVRYYKLWPRPGSAVAREYNVQDFFLPHWIGAQ